MPGVYMAYMFDISRTSHIVWLFESNLRSFGYFKCSTVLWLPLDPSCKYNLLTRAGWVLQTQIVTWCPRHLQKNGSSFQILEMTLQRYQFQNHKVAENTDSAFHPSKINLMSIKDSTGIWWLKVSLHCDSAAFRQLNSIHKVVHWDKWTLKKSIIFCKVYLKYTSDIQLKYA